MIVSIEVISTTKSPAVSRPASAWAPATNSSADRPIAPIICTVAVEMPRVDSTFIARRRLRSASAP